MNSRTLPMASAPLQVFNKDLALRHICLVGAGNIARVHAEVLQTVPGITIAAVVDPSASAAQSLAAQWKVPSTFSSAEEALRSGGLDAAHVLVPPDAHATATRLFLEVGLPTFVEKPLAASSTECAALLHAAAATKATLGTNQNFVFHPAFVRLRRMIEERQLGRPVSVSCTYSIGLRQLQARQFSHWMFRRPLNMLLEQAVHPLSQVAVLAGSPGEVMAQAGQSIEISPGIRFSSSYDVLLRCARLPVQLRFAVGQAFPVWQISVLCDDGVAVADIIANRTYAQTRTRWLPVVDGVLSSARTAGSLVGAELRNAVEYGLSTVRLKERTDPFFRSMRGSIAAFHAALDLGTIPELDGQFGAMMVSTCERIQDTAFGKAETEHPRKAPSGTAVARPVRQGTGPAPRPDVAVLGGTGFIGTQVVRKLRERGLRVSVMARSVDNLPTMFGGEGITLHQGSIQNDVAVAQAVAGAGVVVNLAHGGGGGAFEQVRDAMVGGAETVARICAARRGTVLLHVGSIAALYLGPQPGMVTGTTPPDPHADQRADYARAKAMADQSLLRMHGDSGLQICILRPGLVVGEGTSPFHSGLGFFNNHQHCIGWNQGVNPLPWVLVEDIADAVVLAVARPGHLIGRSFNLVGDVRMTAREYVAELARALERPLRFHPKGPDTLWLQEMGKWVVKRVGGRTAPPPSRRDILSRGLRARFDCGDAKEALGWQPNSDPCQFKRRAILIHAG